MDEKTKINVRITLVLFFVIIIIFSLGFIYANKDTIFRSDVSVKYADGCIERFVNGELVTPECPKEKYEKYRREQVGGLNVNWTGINLPQTNQS